MKAAIPLAGGRNNPATGRGRNNLPATDKEKLERRIYHIKTSVRFTWIPGKFCSNHDHCVGPNHNSASYNEKGHSEGHITTATRNNPVGTGAARNKGWDD